MTEQGRTKHTVSDLALFGGRPAFEEALHVGRPSIGDRDRLFERLGAALDRRTLTNHGPLVDEFEERIADRCSVRHAIAVDNATSGIEIVAKALELRGEVIVPAFTFVGTAHALAWIGLEPVFCDIRADQPTIDPHMAARLIGPRTSAILGVHLWGHVCDVSGLEAVGRAHGTPVVYDAAHAFGSSLHGTPVGTFGRAEVFSFHATKLINSFEGGAICTDDDELAERARSMVSFGFSRYDRTESIGTNAKMSEAAAAMGLTSLEAMPEIVAAHRANAAAYARGLGGLSGVRLIDPEQTEAPNAPYVVVRLDGTAGLARDALIDVLHAERVLARRYFYPGVHRMEPYVQRPELVREPLSNTETLAAEVIVLPTGTSVSTLDIETLCDIIRFSVTHASQISERMGGRAT